MFARRVFVAAAVLLAAAAAAPCQTYLLTETVQTGDCFHLTLDMKLTGEIHVRKGDAAAKLKVTAIGSHEYPERVLVVSDGVAQKTARIYETAKAVVTVGADATERTLRPERRLVVAQRDKEQLVVYSTGGAFTQEELELAHDHFDTLALPGLLPGKAVAVGDTWKITNSITQAVCNFEGVTEQKLTGKLESVKEDTAVFSISGTANGIDQGAMVKMVVAATGKFDLKAKRLTSLEWKQNDDREQGPVSPASTVEATTTVVRKVIDQPASLSDVALVSVPSEAPPTGLVQLDCHDAKGRFSFLYNREWQITSQTNDHVILRLMDNGDFVAQATVTPWTPAEKGMHLTPEAFREAMDNTPGWSPEKELQAGEAPAPEGRWIYRISMVGKMDDVAVLQNFYLVAAPGGEQMVVAVTLTPKQAEKLGARDLALVGGIDLPATVEKK
ncbi:MAG TPA: hypothetical protein DDY78_05365 [Planctomycetales bacterium]|jgi:hypothetical protein|nr:hypothetical protein [Planctomycetales bacterium]